MTEVRVDLSGFDEAERGLVRLLAMLTDLRPFWPRLVPIFVGWMKEQFESEGGWGGDPWAPLSDDYAQRKAMLHPGRGILYATGDLRRAASLPKRRVSPRSMQLIVDDADMRHGAKVPRAVAGYHQWGTDAMPARPIVPEELPLEAGEEVRTAAEAWIDEMATRLGL